jgi:hypothetical protein
MDKKIEVQIPKDNFFSKTDRRVLLKYLEKYYLIKLKNYNFSFNNRNPDEPKTKTRIEKFERQFRLEVKAIETLLYKLGSDLMQNVKIPNYRKTTDINARRNGLIQSERETVDH